MIAVLSLFPDTEGFGRRATVEFDHLVAYWALTILWLLTCRGAAAFVLPGVLAYGLVLELLQIVIPGRSFEWLDLVSNAIGTFAGWGSVLMWRRLAGTES